MSTTGTDKSMRTPLARARGLGSAKDGVHHWWMQRLTAIVLAILTPWFIWQILFLRFLTCTEPAFSCMGNYTAGMYFELGKPSHALPMLAFVLALFWHAKLGLQVVIEDYVHTRWMEVGLQVFNSLACASGALVSVFAIARIMFAH